LLLTAESALNARLLDPRREHPRTYLVQVEGTIPEKALQSLRAGVVIEGRRTRPAKARTVTADLPPRDPPVRFRKSIPTSWIELEIHEGRNRQVRKMTAAVGFPTLRLLRIRIGGFDLPQDLAPGAWRELSEPERQAVFRTRQ
jgi:23S rRNA pseudouridine2457 synthase